ncbi:folylpolyglutamate synthase/dihydrofolate synthase family protein [soil metagenome]
MTVGYAQAVAHLEALGIDDMKGMAPSLHRIEALCRVLDDPQQSVPAIHVTGTNGKSSTARIAASILAATGLSVGVYTSPHLGSVRERIARAGTEAGGEAPFTGGAPIAADAFGDVFDHLRPFLELTEERLGERLTFFEVLTAMYFLWAADNVDVSVVEVGLGGRWDATNVMDAPVAVITNVGLDHTGLLGSDRASIAREKAGVIKPAASVVTAERSPDALPVIAEEAEQAEARLAVLTRDFDILDERIAVGGRLVTVRTSARTYDDLFLPLHGHHQAVNAATALQAATDFFAPGSLDDDVVRAGLAAARTPGRLESLPGGGERATVVLDVAHNPAGTAALVNGLAESFSFERAVFVVGIGAGKDHAGILTEMARLHCSLVVTRAPQAATVPVDELASTARALGLPCEIASTVREALDHALEAAAQGDIVCVTGSHSVVGEARAELLHS